MTTLVRSFRSTNQRLLGAAILALASASPLTVTLAQSSDRGVWHLYADSTRDRVQLSFEHFDRGRRGGMTSFGISPEKLRGLTDAQIHSANSPVRFQLVRDAGTFSFEGEVRDAHGTGFFTFVPDTHFPQQLAARGYERPTADQQFWLALHDIGYALLDELRADGFDRPSVAQLVVMGMHGANLEYIRSLKAAGYRVSDTRRLVMLRDHGVNARFISGLSNAGYTNLSLEDLLSLRDHGVSPDFIAGLRSFGFTGLTTRQLLEARDHGVTESFIREFRELGYADATLRDFVRMRDHGVSARYARDVREADGRLLPVDALIWRRDRGER
jgi:hypothetical protein